tara:strand:- start:178 stop:396 length:219 start_codon:yes stop_codon:yes gene_type:complete
MKKLTFNETQERISELYEDALEENTSSEGSFNRVKQIEKEIKAYEELRESFPEWKELLIEFAEERANEELPF